VAPVKVPPPVDDDDDDDDLPVLTRDLVDVADLRYDEWISGDEDDDDDDEIESDGSSSRRRRRRTPPPTRGAFRMATAEIAAERSALGAVVFLARSSAAVAAAGSAELSPIEFDGALLRINWIKL